MRRHRFGEALDATRQLCRRILDGILRLAEPIVRRRQESRRSGQGMPFARQVKHAHRCPFIGIFDLAETGRLPRREER